MDKQEILTFSSFIFGKLKSNTITGTLYRIVAVTPDLIGYEDSIRDVAEAFNLVVPDSKELESFEGAFGWRSWRDGWMIFAYFERSPNVESDYRPRFFIQARYLLVKPKQVELLGPRLFDVTKLIKNTIPRYQKVNHLEEYVVTLESLRPYYLDDPAMVSTLFTKNQIIFNGSQMNPLQRAHNAARLLNHLPPHLRFAYTFIGFGDQKQQKQLKLNFSHRNEGRPFKLLKSDRKAAENYLSIITETDTIDTDFAHSSFSRALSPNVLEDILACTAKLNNLSVQDPDFENSAVEILTLHKEALLLENIFTLHELLVKKESPSSAYYLLLNWLQQYSNIEKVVASICLPRHYVVIILDQCRDEGNQTMLRFIMDLAENIFHGKLTGKSRDDFISECSLWALRNQIQTIPEFVIYFIFQSLKSNQVSVIKKTYWWYPFNIKKGFLSRLHGELNESFIQTAAFFRKLEDINRMNFCSEFEGSYKETSNHLFFLYFAKYLFDRGNFSIISTFFSDTIVALAKDYKTQGVSLEPLNQILSLVFVKPMELIKSLNIHKKSLYDSLKKCIASLFELNGNLHRQTYAHYHFALIFAYYQDKFDEAEFVNEVKVEAHAAITHCGALSKELIQYWIPNETNRHYTWIFSAMIRSSQFDFSFYNSILCLTKEHESFLNEKPTLMVEVLFFVAKHKLDFLGSYTNPDSRKRLYYNKCFLVTHNLTLPTCHRDLFRYLLKAIEAEKERLQIWRGLFQNFDYVRTSHDFRFNLQNLSDFLANIHQHNMHRVVLQDNRGHNFWFAYLDELQQQMIRDKRQKVLHDILPIVYTLDDDLRHKDVLKTQYKLAQSQRNKSTMLYILENAISKRFYQLVLTLDWYLSFEPEEILNLFRPINVQNDLKNRDRNLFLIISALLDQTQLKLSRLKPLCKSDLMRPFLHLALNRVILTKSDVGAISEFAKNLYMIKPEPLSAHFVPRDFIDIYWKSLGDHDFNECHFFSGLGLVYYSLFRNIQTFSAGFSADILHRCVILIRKLDSISEAERFFRLQKILTNLDESRLDKSNINRVQLDELPKGISDNEKALIIGVLVFSGLKVKNNNQEYIKAFCKYLLGKRENFNFFLLFGLAYSNPHDRHIYSAKKMDHIYQLKAIFSKWLQKQNDLSATLFFVKSTEVMLNYDPQTYKSWRKILENAFEKMENKRLIKRIKKESLIYFEKKL